MNAADMMTTVTAQLALDLNCSPQDLQGEQDRLVFVEAGDNPGRRPFPRGEVHFDMLTMGRAVVVSATATLLAYVKDQMVGKSRDDAFSMPFLYGHSLYYLPDLGAMGSLAAPRGFDYETVEREGMAGLYAQMGFENAIVYDLNHPRPDVLAVCAKSGGVIVAVAGASADCAHLWQMGIDVLPDYRNHGLAAYLVNALAHEILRRGKVPYYGTASSNIASQRVAYRAGLMPGWMCVYHARFEQWETQPIG